MKSEKRKVKRMEKEKAPMREQTTLRMPEELKEQLQKEAEKKGISFNAYLLLLIDRGHQYLQ